MAAQLMLRGHFLYSFTVIASNILALPRQVRRQVTQQSIVVVRVEVREHDVRVTELRKINDTHRI